MQSRESSLQQGANTKPPKWNTLVTNLALHPKSLTIGRYSTPKEVSQLIYNPYGETVLISETPDNSCITAIPKHITTIYISQQVKTKTFIKYISCPNVVFHCLRTRNNEDSKSLKALSSTVKHIAVKQLTTNICWFKFFQILCSVPKTVHTITLLKLMHENEKAKCLSEWKQFNQQYALNERLPLTTFYYTTIEGNHLPFPKTCNSEKRNQNQANVSQATTLLPTLLPKPPASDLRRPEPTTTNNDHDQTNQMTMAPTSTPTPLIPTAPMAVSSALLPPLPLPTQSMPHPTLLPLSSSGVCNQYQRVTAASYLAPQSYTVSYPTVAFFQPPRPNQPITTLAIQPPQHDPAPEHPHTTFDGRAPE